MAGLLLIQETRGRILVVYSTPLLFLRGTNGDDSKDCHVVTEKMASLATVYRRGSRIFERGGGSRHGYKIFHKHPPPLDIVRVTSSDLRKFEKHPTLGHSQTPPPLGHCPRDVIRPQKIWKTPPLLDIHKRGGPTLGPMLKSLHRGPKGGGPDPLDPPPPWIRHWCTSSAMNPGAVTHHLQAAVRGVGGPSNTSWDT